jgi:phosphatidylserine/phosphatidylglycerophosphate/cardiolipin synthase-like enzyme
MPSSNRSELLREFGALLTASDARQILNGITDGEPFSDPVSALDPSKRARVLELAAELGLRSDAVTLFAVLSAIEGAREGMKLAAPIWTMPGHVAKGGELTASLVKLVNGARQSVICSTFNFQTTSGMWQALHDAALRPEMDVRVYIDAEANDSGIGPSGLETAKWLSPAKVFVSRELDGKPLRNHAKYLVVDHRFVVVTSANFSWSAEQKNIELGLRVDDPNLADRIESEIRSVEPDLYTEVKSGQ